MAMPTGDANDVRPTVATSMELNRKRITGSQLKRSNVMQRRKWQTGKLL